jgi:hypothetical protein
MVRIVLRRLRRSCLSCSCGNMKMSGDIVPVDKASWYPGRRAMATKPVTVSLALRCSHDFVDSTISDQMVGGFSSSIVTIVFMRQ